MKKSTILFAGLIGLLLACGLVLAGCDNGSGGNPNPNPDPMIFTISFDAGDGSGTPPPEQKVEDGKSIFMPGRGNMIAPNGKEFDGWRGDGRNLATGDTYTVTKDVMFIAQWKQDTPTFTASTNNNTSNDVATLGLVGTTASSSNASVATVEITGGKIAITSVSAGTATIIVRNTSDNEVQIPVTVAYDGTITIGTITKNNPLIGSWVYPNSDTPTEVALFTGTRAYFSAAVVRRSRQGNLDTGANTIKLEGSGSSVTYDYELTATGLIIKKVIDGTDDVVLKRREGSTNTGLEDVWISSSLSSAQQTYLLIIRETNRGNDILYNWGYNSWWRTDTYTIDSAGDIRWDNWSTIPTDFSFSETGNLTIQFPSLDSYSERNISFVKTTWF